MSSGFRGLSFYRGVLGAFLLVFAIVFITNSFLATEGDFTVFWQAGRHLLRGQPLYDLSRDGPQCFKYPPFIAPFFIPFAFLPLRIAGICWRLLEMLALISCTRWMMQKTNRPELVPCVLLSFWGIWMYNLLTGQVTPVLLALTLIGFTWNEKEQNRRSFWGLFLILLSLSAKIFNLIAILGIRRKNLRIKEVFQSGIFLLVLSLPALIGYRQTGVASLVQTYLETTGSHGAHLGGAGYGLPQLWIHLLSLPDLSSTRILGFFLSSLLCLPFLCFGRSSAFSPEERFALWLALAALVHPLLFTYGLAWAFPLAVFALNQALLRQGWERILLLIVTLTSLSGVLFLDRLPVPSLAYSPFPIRALSLLFLAISFVFSKKDRPTHFQHNLY